MSATRPRRPYRFAGYLPAIMMLGLALLNLLPTWRVWRGDWWLALERLNLGLFFVLGVLAACAAYEAARPGGVADAEVVLSPRPTRTRLVALVWLVGPTVVVYLFAVGAVGIVTLLASGAPSGNVSPIVASLCSFVFAGALGLAIGALLEMRIAIPLALIVQLSLAIGPLQPGRFDVFPTPGGQGSYAGFVPNSSSFLLQVLVLLAGAALLLTVRKRPSRRGDASPHFAPFAVIAAALLASSFLGPGQRFSAGHDEPDRCADVEIPICVFPGYDRMLASSARTISKIIRQASEDGLDHRLLPARVHQRVIGGDPPDRGTGALFFDDEQLGDATLSVESAAFTLANPLWCKVAYGGPGGRAPVAFLRKRDAVTVWLVARVEPVDPRAFANYAPALAHVSTQRQLELVSDYLREFRDCPSVGDVRE